MTSEDEFFKDAEHKTQFVETDGDIVHPDLIRSLKQNRDEVVTLYAKLIANPYLAPELVDDFRSSLMNTLGSLIEHGIPVSHDSKIRTADDIIKEGLAELGGILGAKAFGIGLKAKRSFDESMKDIREGGDDFKIYRDPDTGEYYFIDPDTGEEVDCDADGNPLE